MKLWLFVTGKAKYFRAIRFDSSFAILHPPCVVSLPEHRKAIDKLDAQIVRLLA